MRGIAILMVIGIHSLPQPLSSWGTLADAPLRAYGESRPVLAEAVAGMASGTNAASVIAVEKKMALSTCRALAKIIRIRVLQLCACAGGAYALRTPR